MSHLYASGRASVGASVCVNGDEHIGREGDWTEQVTMGSICTSATASERLDCLLSTLTFPPFVFSVQKQKP